ncbi:transmembrane protein, putative (macronuclear) [Tetrahymena thermophila SB210]|uniref:Transmembrane protein, putative n=1 Tax=Tetrahymena thermophila (strain SB210) TaxID=312017 RepID=Q24CW6_TETTS|nr:transmembrane protein, putative [Tetrahymena thermophila SB210]8B6G_CK Chain CK, Transmembrane protein, putative [Tetrahymena thermophila]8BQS_CK Chain CK, Transmembrane protein, putative [Tetrahymena thermophila SB210]8GYM_2K Chain 2K, Transmembrane protein, putative [Tetrahymena thermophila SB210]8GYM_2k Chain 2k, Transmembrane protein, putative [Tetrahymena thermophila SB210]8GZU_2K Chain 2K, Transmembrane protein, putative [Tetrahymena thermophila SB210]8GZU_2k Chain 2k, Transmembrane |eukprot:XP_001025887.1 transmembrane protein, putative [Tetrahymena thermophila SB210]
MLDDTKYIQMAQKFPRNVSVQLNKKLFVTRTWFRNYYFVGVFGIFAYFIYNQPKIFAPFSGYPTTVAYKAQPDFLNDQVIFYSQQRQNTLKNF